MNVQTNRLQEEAVFDHFLPPEVQFEPSLALIPKLEVPKVEGSRVPLVIPKPSEALVDYPMHQAPMVADHVDNRGSEAAINLIHFIS